ncbi:hypothetical protein AKJ50_01175 [candidate division MSBL1 archaeon SCGC-AAA382A13]|uniref:Uncharacterized protein n=1 Tax=candidate division MSBL1 archaeon SCGC-AAA382A13 TaxID=1698279 RepID=A0A133VFZ7_9EURY|nr:hypothetical protein AKJ50_01175 [candidate division MSBL1 archaeon SCGC-AAA382A13]
MGLENLNCEIGRYKIYTLVNKLVEKTKKEGNSMDFDFWLEKYCEELNIDKNFSKKETQAIKDRVRSETGEHHN